MAALTQFRNWWSQRFGKLANEEAEAKKIALNSHRLINTYGAVIEKYPAGYVDASVLPADKDTLKLAMKIVWKFSDDEFRRILGGGFVGLYRFQDGVGPKPITSLSKDVSLDDFKSLNDKEALQAVIDSTREFLSWSARTNSEMEALFAEFKAFEQAQRAISH